MKKVLGIFGVIAIAFAVWSFVVGQPYSTTESASKALPKPLTKDDVVRNASPVFGAPGVIPVKPSIDTVPRNDGLGLHAIRGENWAKYPGTLNDQITRAMDSQDAAMALYLAQRMADCVTYVTLPELLGRHNLNGGLGLSPEDLVMKSHCQTVGGDWQNVSFKLFEKAVSGQVPGAAADMFRATGKLSDSASKQIVIDAQSGHLWSVITIAAVPAKVLNVPSDEQVAAQYAIRSAVQKADQKTGQAWSDALQSISSRWNVILPSDSFNPSEQVRDRGAIIAAKILANEKKQ